MKEEEKRGKKPISFGWTADRLLAGAKTATRRIWKPVTTEYFQRSFKGGIRFFPAFNQSHYANGYQIGWLELLQEPYLQNLSEMQLIDVKKEGFPELTVQEFVDKFFNGQDQEVTVIEFNFHSLLPPSQHLVDRAEECDCNFRLWEGRKEENGEFFSPQEFTERAIFTANWCENCTKSSKPNEFCLILSEVGLQEASPFWMWWNNKPLCIGFEKKEEK